MEHPENVWNKRTVVGGEHLDFLKILPAYAIGFTVGSPAENALGTEGDDVTRFRVQRAHGILTPAFYQKQKQVKIPDRKKRGRNCQNR